jgi:hypothetical protein
MKIDSLFSHFALKAAISKAIEVKNKEIMGSNLERRIWHCNL